MNWWISFCWIAGGICFALLDRRLRRQAGKPWLSEWPWRLVTYFALGGVFAAIGYAPIFLYHLGEAIVGLYNHPPTLSMMAALPILAVSVIIASAAISLAYRTIRGISGPQRDVRSMASVRRIAVALVLFAVAVGVLGTGSFYSLYVLQNHRAR